MDSFFSGPEVSRFLQVSSIADLVLDVSKILAARNFAEIFLFCTVLGKVLLFKTNFLSRFYDLWKICYYIESKIKRQIFKVSFWPQIQNILTIDRVVFHFCLNKKLSIFFGICFLSKAPSFLQELKKNLDNEK